MQRLTRSLATLASIAATALLYPSAGFAAGEAAGNTVENKATVTYAVGGTLQTGIESSPTGNTVPGVNQGEVTDFTVDRVIDLTLIQQGGAANTTVNPGQSAQVTAFVLTNTSNAAQGYTFAAADLTGGTVNGTTPDTFDLVTNSIQVFVDANGNNTYEPATDTATTVSTLAADDLVTVFVVGDIPLGVSDGAVANVELTATTVEPTSGAAITASTSNDEDTQDTVIRNVSAAAQDGYEVEAAALTISKGQAVISDGVNTAAPFFFIPGAVVEYTITIDNLGGSQAAQSVVVTDKIAAALDISSSTTVTIDNNGTGSTCTVDVGDVDSDNCSRVDNGDNTSDLTIGPGITVAAGTSATVTFRVTIR